MSFGGRGADAEVKWEMLLCWVGAGRVSTVPIYSTQTRGCGSCEPAWGHRNPLIAAAQPVAHAAKPTKRVELCAL